VLPWALDQCTHLKTLLNDPFTQTADIKTEISASAIAMVKCAQIGGLRNQADLTREFTCLQELTFLHQLMKCRLYCSPSHLDEVSDPLAEIY
jgi:hypothetical protein